MPRRRRSLGKAFPDQLHKVNGLSGHFNVKHLTGGAGWEDSFLPNYSDPGVGLPVSPWRLVVLASVCILVFGGLFLRLFHLQIAYGAENRDLADSNRVQIRVIHAPRGVIYDRNGKIMASNEPGFRLKKEIISRDQALEWEVKGDSRFHQLEIDNIRNYPMASASAHLVGYVGEITEEEMRTPEYDHYKLGDRIGRGGVEQIYEHVLKGEDGAEIIEVDAQGQRIRSLKTIDPIPGQNLYLAVDADLQKTLFDALSAAVTKVGSCCGAAVAEDPQNGQVLALASFPSFDSNLLTHPGHSSEVQTLFTDPRALLLNRAIGGTYPPGSTFKIASAFAGLASKKITDKTIIEDTGIMALGPYTFANWYFTEYGRKEGPVDIIKALQRSNDIFFYQLGQQVGETALGDAAKKLGFGKKLGIDLPGELDGLIPTDEWKQKTIGEVWYPGDTLHMSIGQGYVLATPLQVLAQTAYVASNGLLMQPHLALRITSPEGATVKEFNYSPIEKNIFPEADLKLVQRGLSQVPKNGGTAWPFFSFTVPSAGKTGTAEFGHPKNFTHAWYTAYAPEDHPQIAITALVEAGGEGSTVASPIVKQAFTWYFSPDKTKLTNFDLAPVATASARTLGE